VLHALIIVSSLLESLPMYMMIGIILVIGISQFNRIAGGILGVVFWGAVAVIGSAAYDQGGGIGVPGFRFSRELFYGVCGLFSAFSAFSAYTAYTKRSRIKRALPRDDSTTDE
jgi:hypothetical protein